MFELTFEAEFFRIPLTTFFSNQTSKNYVELLMQDLDFGPVALPQNWTPGC